MQDRNFGAQDAFYERRVLFTWKDRPNFEGDSHGGMVSIPMMTQIIQQPLDNILFKRLLVSVHDPDDHEKIDKIAKDLKDVTNVAPKLLYES